MKKVIVIVLLIISGWFTGYSQENKQVIKRAAKETITPIELNHNEIIKYQRLDGQVLTIELISTDARIIWTNRDKIPEDEPAVTHQGTRYGEQTDRVFRNPKMARLMYEFSCKVKINGVLMNMRRYVGSQEALYEPYVINGVRIWFTGVQKIFEEYGGFLTTRRNDHNTPGKHARFVLHDMTQRICPDDLYAWFKDGKDRNDNFIYQENFIDVGRAYNGDDVHMGAYMGFDSHGGLDVDMAKKSLMYAPFDLDNQSGIRGAGTRKWPNGSEWRINTGHIIEKLVPDNTPLKGGQAYGIGAARGTGQHPHSHFAFEIFEEGISYDIDSWIIFWQLFKDNKKRDGILRAMMAPLTHSRTGEKIKFQNLCKQAKYECDSLQFFWTFGDVGASSTSNSEHVFTKPGIYPVTLTVDNGYERAAFTQHITIEGKELETPSLSLTSHDVPSFRRRPIEALDVYSWPVKFIPHSLKFLARASRPQPKPKFVQIENLGGGELDSIVFGIDYQNNRYFNWIQIRTTGIGNKQEMKVAIDAKNLPPGKYKAIVSVHCNSALNSPQDFIVELTVPDSPAKTAGVIIDDGDEEFYCTPYFWVGHRFHGWGWPELKNAEGYNHFYLINGERPKAGEFARFTPDLEVGTYEIWLYEKTPFSSGPPAYNTPARFQVYVEHAEGDTTVWMEPEKTKGYFPCPFQTPNGWGWREPQPSRKIGTFKFEEGNDGYVEILSEGSTGQIIVDAIRFLKMD